MKIRALYCGKAIDKCVHISTLDDGEDERRDDIRVSNLAHMPNLMLEFRPLQDIHESEKCSAFEAALVAIVSTSCMQIGANIF